MLKVLDKIFIISLLSFLLLGVIIVATQLLGLIMQNGNLIVIVNNNFATPAFVCSAIAGVLGFFIQVLKNRSFNVLSEEELEDLQIEAT
ncbi:hypothetical protein WAX74_19680 [Psychrobacillus sp. FJAT-51614]|uniref:Lipopolysaccharide assembly protein A domain-containing protein n=1 Tax=Psychrobacillus mangrovi TaxID=3117745 RepID=A0ABU8F9Y6_9BACI